MAALQQNEYDQFLTSIMVKLAGASTTGVNAQLFETMKEFFKDSNAWREDIPVQATAAIVTYALNPRDNGQIIRLIGVWDQNASPQSAFMPDFGTLKLVNAPN